jgi:hypothetical protein
VNQAVTADLPAVRPAGPRQMVSVIWLATTAAVATRMNRLNRLPTLVWSLLFTAALIRDGPNVMRHPVLRETGWFAVADIIELRRPSWPRPTTPLEGGR